MINFGDLEVVEKTFTREGGAVRTQSYNGIKFRRYDSNKGKKDAEAEGKEFVPFVEEQFIISNKAWADLNLETYALTQAKGGLLMVLEDQEEVKPVAKFLRTSITKEGKPQKKGKMFSNEFLVADLVETGAITATEKRNHYLKLVDVSAQVQGMPDHVKGVYQLVEDDTISAQEIAAENEVEDTNSF
jgi:hypothetical protein